MLQNFTILRQNLKNMGSSYQVKAKEKKNKNLSHIILLIFNYQIILVLIQTIRSLNN